ncbi:MAG TPA: DUF5069 domain-containing protein [Candidatus Baltobacteraceae bacterium]|jgi:hypothetical protein|nr:DUF5069 domain-containing protein [Candidatus Baltobacteraceae bacterium]
MDLTKTYPRSVREKFAGIVQLGRTTDKAKAFAAGTIGEYHYNCPMDQAVFRFLGIDHEAYLAKVRTAKSDAEIETYARQFTSKKSPADLDRWSEEWLEHEPESGSEGEAFFLNLRAQVAPNRTDVTTWADVLDLDEKRNVPIRERAKSCEVSHAKHE